MQQNNATVAPGTSLRPHTPIHRDEIRRTRRFEFERNHGLVTFGDERTGRWAALPSLMKPKQIVDAMLRITRER